MIETWGPGVASRTSRREGVNWRWVGHLIALGAAAAIAAVAIWIYLSFRIGIISGKSMMPTLAPGDRYIVDLRAYCHAGPRRRDIVVFRSGDDLLVKRIIGLPGDNIVIFLGQVYVNDRPLEEPYLYDRPIVENPLQVEVPKGRLFVLGDSRNNSDDSRYFGTISMDVVLGRADYLLFPAARRGSLLPRAMRPAGPKPTR